MKTLTLLAIVTALTSPVFAQKPGLFVTAGGGVARADVGDIVVYNPVADAPGGEPLVSTKRKDTLSVVRLTVGYNFTENWALQLSYADFSTGKVKLASPQYPGITWTAGTGPDIYQRHVLKYKPTAISLIPSYTHAISGKSRIILGGGVSGCTTKSHFETTVVPGGTAAATPVTTSYAEETLRGVGCVILFGVDTLLTDSLSVQFTGNYTALRTKVPSASPWAARAKSNVNINTFCGEISLAWHW